MKRAEIPDAMPAEIRLAIEQALRNGEYHTAEDVIRGALYRLLDDRAEEGSRPEIERRADTERLKRLWDEGLASGEPIEMD